jgi:hypothetical protein
LNRITAAARSLEKGEEYDSEKLKPAMRSRDELGNLARIFDKMALEVRAREQKLRQQIADLRIEIDVAKRTQQVSEIADTDYFRDLQAKARQLRGQGAVSNQPSAVSHQQSTISSQPSAGDGPLPHQPADEGSPSRQPLRADS